MCPDSGWTQVQGQEGADVKDDFRDDIHLKGFRRKMVAWSDNSLEYAFYWSTTAGAGTPRDVIEMCSNCDNHPPHSNGSFHAPNRWEGSRVGKHYTHVRITGTEYRFLFTDCEGAGWLRDPMSQCNLTIYKRTIDHIEERPWTDWEKAVVVQCPQRTTVYSGVGAGQQAHAFTEGLKLALLETVSHLDLAPASIMLDDRRNVFASVTQVAEAPQLVDFEIKRRGSGLAVTFYEPRPGRTPRVLGRMTFDLEGLAMKLTPREWRPSSRTQATTGVKRRR